MKLDSNLDGHLIIKLKISSMCSLSDLIDSDGGAREMAQQLIDADGFGVFDDDFIEIISVETREGE